MYSGKYGKFGLLILSVFMLCCLSYFGIIAIREVSHQIAIQRLGKSLGIAPSWTAFNDYMFSKLKKGMTREQVIHEFEKVGSYVVRPQTSDGCEVVEFKLGLLNITSYALILCYDSDEVQSLRYFTLYDY